MRVILALLAAAELAAAQNRTSTTPSRRLDEVRGPPYPLGAHTAWSVGSHQYRRVRDELQNWQKRDITECFSGSSNYQKTTVFCDRQCIQKVGRHNIAEHEKKCAGPWYCAKSASSQEYNKDLFSVKRALSFRRAIDSYSCATLEQCFPTPEDAEKANVQPADLPSGGNSYARTAHFGGVRVETSCCANGRHYNHLVDQPCNGAASRRVFAALGVSLASLLFLL